MRVLGALGAMFVLQISPPVGLNPEGPGSAVGSVPAFENEYVQVAYVLIEVASQPGRTGPAPPIVRYIRIDGTPAGRIQLEPPRPPADARPSWRPGVVARAIYIKRLLDPPAPSELGEPGTDLPRNAVEGQSWPGGQFVSATFRPLDYAVGTGRFPSVTTFLSDGVIEVWHRRETRRRIGVQAGDAFWFEAGTRITVVDDYPVAAAIVQLRPGRRKGERHPRLPLVESAGWRPWPHRVPDSHSPGQLCGGCAVIRWHFSRRSRSTVRSLTSASAGRTSSS
jgi:hypothetical protein